MLSKAFRLPAYLIPEVLKKGKRFYFDFFTLIVFKNKNECNQSFLAVITPKKIFKKAVLRNKIKRFVSEALTTSLFKIKPDYNVIFMAKKNIMGEKFASIKTEIEKSLMQAKLLK